MRLSDDAVGGSKAVSKEPNGSGPNPIPTPMLYQILLRPAPCSPSDRP